MKYTYLPRTVDLILAEVYILGMARRLRWGVGLNDFNTNVRTNGKLLASYVCWNGMLERCYGSKRQIIQPTYVNCTVCAEWLSFTNFKNWYDANYVNGFALDKDILVPDNKVYGPDACRFVPQRINNLLLARGNDRGRLPCGVSAKKPDPKIGQVNYTYMASCSRTIDGITKRITKTFKTVEDARCWYLDTKRAYVKQVALEAFLANEIKSDVYLALVRREFT